MPYLILKLSPLIAVDGLRTAKLGDPGFNELVGDHFGFFAWNRVGDSEFRESVLTGEDIAVALIRFWKRTNEKVSVVITAMKRLHTILVIF